MNTYLQALEIAATAIGMSGDQDNDTTIGLVKIARQAMDLARDDWSSSPNTDSIMVSLRKSEWTEEDLVQLMDEISTAIDLAR